MGNSASRTQEQDTGLLFEIAKCIGQEIIVRSALKYKSKEDNETNRREIQPLVSELFSSKLTASRVTQSISNFAKSFVKNIQNWLSSTEAPTERMQIFYDELSKDEDYIAAFRELEADENLDDDEKLMIGLAATYQSPEAIDAPSDDPETDAIVQQLLLERQGQRQLRLT